MIDIFNAPELIVERERFSNEIRKLIEETQFRRKHILSAVSVSGSVAMSEDEFIKAVKVVGGNPLINVERVCAEACIERRRFDAWITGVDAPLHPDLRVKLIELLLAAATCDYLECSPLREIRQMSVRNTLIEATSSNLPLSASLDELGLFTMSSVRIRNVLNNESIVTLGELLSYTAIELGRLPNFGRKSVAEIEIWLAGTFGCQLGSLSNSEREFHKRCSEARAWLMWVAGSELCHQWQYHGQSEVTYADKALLEALRGFGISYVTQLATTPKDVLEVVCSGREDWKAMLPHLLGNVSGRSASCMLYLPVPSFLPDNVKVYVSD